MEITDDINEKFYKLGDEIFTVLSLSRILVECDGADDEINHSDRQVLIRVLSEKAFISREKFNELELLI